MSVQTQGILQYFTLLIFHIVMWQNFLSTLKIFNVQRFSVKLPDHKTFPALLLVDVTRSSSERGTLRGAMLHVTRLLSPTYLVYKSNSFKRLAFKQWNPKPFHSLYCSFEIILRRDYIFSSWRDSHIHLPLSAKKWGFKPFRYIIVLHF